MADNDPGTIRAAGLADAPDLARVHVASWRETYPGMVPDAMLSALSVEGRTAMWDQILRQPATPASTVVYVIEVDSKIVGLGSCGSQRAATLKKRGYDAEIYAIYVLKVFQRRAMGTRLLSAMASNLSARGFGALSLWVLRNNAVARQFYERNGGKVVADREDVRANGVLVEVAYGWMDLAELAQPNPAGNAGAPARLGA
jgi:hypothetical protein